MADAGPAPQATDRCGELRRGLQRATEETRGKLPVDAFHTLSRFVDGMGGDPTDCVTTEARHELAAIEKGLVVMRTAGMDLKPDRVVYCNELAPTTLVCNGPEADETALVGEASLARPLGPVPPEASVTTAPGYDGQILGVYAADHGALQEGKPPTRVSAGAVSVHLQSARRSKGPVVIVTARRQDSLGFRKFVWYFATAR